MEGSTVVPDGDPGVDSGLAADLGPAEAWFREQGLPWFVDAVDERVRRLLRRRRVVVPVAGAVAAGTAAGWLTLLAADDWPAAVLVALLVLLAALLAYAGGPLRVGVMARWAARRAVAELDLLPPLVTRALPLLLLFVTFLFVNTEVWQMASALDRPSLYAVVLLFATLAATFLFARLPEEVRRVQRAAGGEALAEACRGTPLEARARTLTLDGPPAGGPEAPADPDVSLTRTQRANLLLVLVVTQAFQVLLLALAVFAFFVGFGLLALRRSVIETWIGHPPTPVRWDLGPVTVHLPVTAELYQVSLLLSAFAGLYFTVYALNDATYRAQFLAGLSRGLEQAIGVRRVYLALLATPSSVRQRDSPSPDGGR